MQILQPATKIAGNAKKKTLDFEFKLFLLWAFRQRLIASFCSNGQ